MPIHEYKCDECGEVTEQLELSGDKEIETCPKCGAETHMIMSNNNFILKGSGWYATDYQKKTKPKITKKEVKANGK